MGMFQAINTASSGLTVDRLRLDVISNNIANAETTSSEEGGTFRRSNVILAPVDQKTIWKSPLTPRAFNDGVGTGVEAKSIALDMDKELKYKYMPSHPHAAKSGPHKGYVAFPNVDVVEEMVDMISASRAYEANSAIIEGAKSMFRKSLEIGR